MLASTLREQGMEDIGSTQEFPGRKACRAHQGAFLLGQDTPKRDGCDVHGTLWHIASSIMRVYYLTTL